MHAHAYTNRSYIYRMTLHSGVAGNKDPGECLIHFLIYQTLVFGPVPITIFRLPILRHKKFLTKLGNLLVIYQYANFTY
jgi:hypothetical protein